MQRSSVFHNLLLQSTSLAPITATFCLTYCVAYSVYYVYDGCEENGENYGILYKHRRIK